MKFDQMIREGRDTDAIRLFARQYYEGGKMGHTRMLLLVRVAAELDERRELQEAQSRAIVREQKRAEAAERAVERLAKELMNGYGICPPECNPSDKACLLEIGGLHGGQVCVNCWREWAMGGDSDVD